MLTGEQDSSNEFPEGLTAGGSGRQLVESACVLWEADLKTFLLGVVRDRHVADDVFQRTVMNAIRAAESASEKTLRGWLFKVALNEARQYQRDRSRENKHRERLAQQLAVSRSSQIESDDAEWMVSSGALSAEMSQAIQASMKKLSEEQQEIIRRRIYGEQTFAEIASDLNLPLGTVLTWMRRGLQKLREDSGLRSFWNQ